MNTNYLKLILVISSIAFSCKRESVGIRLIKPFAILNDTTIALNDDINRNSLKAFNEAIRQNPETTLLIFKEAPGSEDDEVNVQLGRSLRKLRLNTHVENNGFIASGAVDLFLAGINRSIGENAQVGVHSWSDGKREANEFSEDAEEHQLYIQYYIDIGIEEQLARDFYFFTINAAPAADIHWMTKDEIMRYSISTE
ncbi:hypothetical protein [Ekhidna sp.]